MTAPRHSHFLTLTTVTLLVRKAWSRVTSTTLISELRLNRERAVASLDFALNSAAMHPTLGSASHCSDLVMLPDFFTLLCKTSGRTLGNL